jgi:hypothetical protein
MPVRRLIQDTRRERLPVLTLGHVFYSAAPIFLALDVLERGVVSPNGHSRFGWQLFVCVTSSSLLGYLVAAMSRGILTICFFELRVRVLFFLSLRDLLQLLS